MRERDQREAGRSGGGTSKPRTWRSWAVASLLVAAVATAAGAVSVSPVALFLSPSNRSGVLMLLNDGTSAEEVEIGFAYGYPVSDSLGNVRVQFFDTVAPGEPSLVPYLRAFPRRLRLEPGQRQAVRVLVDAPANLPVSEYWARVMVHSRGGQPPVESRQGTITMRLDLETVLGVSVNYRQGPVKTGVHVEALRAGLDSAGAELLLDLRPEGNAAFRGRAHVELVAPDGHVLAEHQDELAVYRPLRWRFTVPLPAGTTPPAGSVLRYTIDSERPDLPVGAALAASAQHGQIALTSRW